VYIPYDIMFVSVCDNTKAMYRPCFYNWVVNIDPSADKAWSQQVETTALGHTTWSKTSPMNFIETSMSL